MRIVLVAAAALLVMTLPSTALAAPGVIANDAAVGVRANLGDAATIGLQATKKKTTKKTTKKKPASSSSEKVSIYSIGDATRGKSSLEIKGKAKEGRNCEIKVTWRNGNPASDSAVTRSDKICEMHVGVPNSSGVTGDAKAELTVRDSKGKKVGEASATFQVK